MDREEGMRQGGSWLDRFQSPCRISGWNGRFGVGNMQWAGIGRIDAAWQDTMSMRLILGKMLESSWPS